MEYRKIATGMIEATYEYYKEISVNEDKEGYGLTLDEFLESYYIAVWNDMDNNTKCAAIEYVYNKRNEIELHSGYAEAWVQATAYFLINNFTCDMGATDISLFFDDMDFEMQEINDDEIKKIFGICSNFNDKF
jgi:hypothetical protein